MVVEGIMTENKRTFTFKIVFQLVIVVVILPLLPMIISGVWDWWEAWVYAAVSALGFVLSRGLAARRHPDILKERARSMELQDAKRWDRILAPIVAVGSIFILAVAGLDKLLGWTFPFSLQVKIIALVAILLGYGLGTWALVENRFFSGVVRIQTDRGHHVVTTGPYRFIRHPGYAGALLSYLCMPILFDSLWAWIPTLLLVVVLFIRTGLEDKTLQTELPGYREYAQKTRYRLIPGIW